ncbi:MAG: hypothetical protein QOH68_4165 [Nocardioidaceae bacterium]|nr:hypothetical protein [Nocardioidaceae bacterium]
MPLGEHLPAFGVASAYRPPTDVGLQWVAAERDKTWPEKALTRSFWWRGQDLNLRPSGYEPDELPSCSTPRRSEIVTVANTDFDHNPQSRCHIIGGESGPRITSPTRRATSVGLRRGLDRRRSTRTCRERRHRGVSKPSKGRATGWG